MRFCLNNMMRSSLLSGHKCQFEESFYNCDDHLLSGNENGSLNFEELNNIITFHLESCEGPCNHNTDDSSIYSSGDSTSSIDLDDEDDLMEPASEPACSRNTKL